MRDLRLICASAFLRSLAVSMSAILLGLHLARLGWPETSIGGVVSAGLWGGAAAAALATFFGDRAGRRRFLFLLALLCAGGGAVAALASGVAAVGAAAFVGTLNGMGRDRGAAMILEQAMLPSLGPPGKRTRTFALYNFCQDAGNAAGSALAALPAMLQGAGLGAEAAGRGALLAYPLLHLAGALCARRLSPAVEAPPDPHAHRVSAATKRVLLRISALFAVDSVAGGFLTTSLVTLIFARKFGAGVGTVALLFAFARVANALSHLGAAALARRIGLVNTMVFTHIPAGLLLVTVAVAPNFPVAALLFLLRESLVEMDVPTRQSYVMAVVRPEERTIASGVTALVRLGGWAAAPAFAGLFMREFSIVAPLLVGAAMKISYDILLWISFRRLRPPEEALLDRPAG